MNIDPTVSFVINIVQLVLILLLAKGWSGADVEKEIWRQKYLIEDDANTQFRREIAELKTRTARAMSALNGESDDE